MAPLFKRDDKTTIAELEEYYANQKKRRSGMAWLMAALSLLITVAVIVVLFIGGRWAYQEFFVDDSREVAVSTEENGQDVDLPSFDSEDETIGGDRGISFEEGSTNDPDNLIVEEGGTVQSGTVTDEAVSTNESNADRVAGTNIGGDNNITATNEIPNTGTGETALIFLVITAVVGYLTSRKRQLSKTTD